MNTPDNPGNGPREVKMPQPGTGHYCGFICALCCVKHGTNGRKLQRVRGVRQYVCKGCYRAPKP